MSSVKSWKKISAVLLRAPSLVIPRCENHHRPCIELSHQQPVYLEVFLYTHNQPGQDTAQSQSICGQDKDTILSFNDPLGNSYRFLSRLNAIRVPVFLQILAGDVVRQSLVRFSEVNEMRVGVFFSLVFGELDLVGMELQRDSLKVFLDEGFVA